MTTNKCIRLIKEAIADLKDDFVVIKMYSITKENSEKYKADILTFKKQYLEKLKYVKENIKDDKEKQSILYNFILANNPNLKDYVELKTKTTIKDILDILHSNNTNAIADVKVNIKTIIKALTQKKTIEMLDEQKS